MLSVIGKRLLVFECALFSVLAVPLFALMFLHGYTFHFEQVTLNYYTNGKVDFTTDATGLVRSLATIAMLSLIFGITTGAAIGLTCSPHFKTSFSEEGLGGYEEEMSKTGFVEIKKTDQGTTYKLTGLGRRFLRDYSFLEKTEENIA
jgi:hypothetical protein